MFIIENIVLGLISGIISGIITGFLVYWITKKRENKYRAFCNLRSFVFRVLEKCEIHIPIDILEDLKTLAGNNKRLKDSLKEIVDCIHPKNSEDIEYSEEEIRLFNSIQIAIEELNYIQKKKHF